MHRCCHYQTVIEDAFDLEYLAALRDEIVLMPVQVVGEACA